MSWRGETRVARPSPLCRTIAHAPHDEGHNVRDEHRQPCHEGQIGHGNKVEEDGNGNAGTVRQDRIIGLGHGLGDEEAH